MTNEYNFYIRTPEDLVNAINIVGFLPLFANDIPGFSAEEHTAPEALWGAEDGLWEWKGPVIRRSGCAYGKFLMGKAAFINRYWFPDFANVRRDGYDFDARYDEGLAPHRDKVLYDLVERHAPVVSLQLKELGDYRKGGVKGFETTISRLQAQCYVTVSDFTYRTNRRGERTGWGLAEYSTPEKQLGADFCERVYEREPEESRERLLTHLRWLLPDVSEERRRKLLG